MKRFWSKVRRFFAPPENSSTLTRIAPYVVVAFLVVVLFVFSTTAWEFTNQTQFCGLTCHTMPPEFKTHQLSAHANVSCEDCHMGRDNLNVLLPRKAVYSWQTGSAMVFGTFQYPIIAKNMRPARDACENCHNPDKFSSDKMVQLKRFANDQANTLTTTYMLLKTGGGSSRQGLGFGIHWHVENPVYFYATDPERQNIPYVLVTRANGTTDEYIDAQSNFDPKTITRGQLQVMDCITCHNRTAHNINSPSETMDDLMGRNTVSPTIPEIHKKGIEVLSAKYDDQEKGVAAIAGLEQFYQQNYPEYYKVNAAVVKYALNGIKDAYLTSIFPEQKIDWATHPNNIQHISSPGCFRCHDGKHVSPSGKDTVRLECNLCHSIPAVSTSFQLVSEIPVSKGFEPDTHKNPNWINMHRNTLDASCKSCHTVDDPGGTSNKSFCSNSVCHSAKLNYVNLDAPKLREIVKAQMPTLVPSPTPAPTKPAASGAQPTKAANSGGAVTFAQVGPLLADKCKACHGDNAIKGLNLTSYAKVMAGSSDGPVVVAGKPDQSPLVKTQSNGGHPGQLSPDELELVKQWISAGAPE